MQADKYYFSEIQSWMHLHNYVSRCASGHKFDYRHFGCVHCKWHAIDTYLFQLLLKVQKSKSYTFVKHSAAPFVGYVCIIQHQCLQFGALKKPLCLQAGTRTDLKSIASLQTLIMWCFVFHKKKTRQKWTVLKYCFSLSTLIIEDTCSDTLYMYIYRYILYVHSFTC